MPGAQKDFAKGILNSKLNFFGRNVSIKQAAEQSEGIYECYKRGSGGEAQAARGYEILGKQAIFLWFS